MTTYNPYAYQGYEVKATSDNKYVSAKQMYKWLFCLMVILLMVTSFYLIRAAAGSSSSDAVMQGEQIVTVSSGDTLWSIANLHYENVRDTGYAVFLIKQRNGLSSNFILPGDQLILPQQP
jgi:LysM repeat protein